MNGTPHQAGTEPPIPQDIDVHGPPIPGECPVEPPAGNSQWPTLEGVAVQRRGRTYLQGPVDAARPDSSGPWLAALGNAGRELIWQDGGLTVHVLEPQALGHSSLRHQEII